MPTATKSLSYPFPAYPNPGEPIEVAPGIYWLITSLPFRLRSINLWLLRDTDGWTMVDCGYSIPEVHEQIERAWSSVLDSLPITRLIVTHSHSDHMGNCLRISTRWGISPTMTAGCYRHSQSLFMLPWDQVGPHLLAFYRRAGVSEESIREMHKVRHRRRQRFDAIPEKWNRIQDGDSFEINGHRWHVITGYGHDEEQALLHSPELGLLISGDQIMAKISPNVSVFWDSPGADPLTGFLKSNRRLAQLCGDVLVLASHKLPFRGLHARVRALEAHHRERLDKIKNFLKDGPLTAAAFVPLLFGDLDAHQMGIALGEALAHLNHLVATGQARCLEQGGLLLFASV